MPIIYTGILGERLKRVNIEETKNSQATRIKVNNNLSSSRVFSS